jgi:hypothetical protein
VEVVESWWKLLIFRRTHLQAIWRTFFFCQWLPTGTTVRVAVRASNAQQRAFQKSARMPFSDDLGGNRMFIVSK